MMIRAVSWFLAARATATDLASGRGRVHQSGCVLKDENKSPHGSRTTARVDRETAARVEGSADVRQRREHVVGDDDIRGRDLLGDGPTKARGEKLNDERPATACW